MSWKYKVELKDIRDSHENGDLSLEELAHLIAVRLKKIKVRDIREAEGLQDELNDIIFEFENFINEVDDVDFFDNILETLYDWGDIYLGDGQKLCWIGFAI